MSNTVKQLGFIPTNRGEFDTTGQTRYYKDNVVQYRNGSYICSPVGYSSSNPTAYTTDAPYQDSDTQLNANWKLMASVGLVDSEPTAGSDNLVKSGGVYEEISQVKQGINGTIVNSPNNIHIPFKLYSGKSYNITNNSETSCNIYARITQSSTNQISIGTVPVGNSIIFNPEVDYNYLYFYLSSGSATYSINVKYVDCIIDNTQYLDSNSRAFSSVNSLALGNNANLLFKGYLGGASWSSLENSSHILIICKPGDEISIVGSTHSSHFGFLRDYNVVTENSRKILFCEGTGRTIVSAGSTSTATAPSDVKFLVVSKLVQGVDYYPESIKVNGIEVPFTQKNVKNYLDDLASDVSVLKNKTTDILDMLIKSADITLNGVSDSNLILNTPIELSQDGDEVEIVVTNLYDNVGDFGFSNSGVSSNSYYAIQLGYSRIGLRATDGTWIYQAQRISGGISHKVRIVYSESKIFTYVDDSLFNTYNSQKSVRIISFGNGGNGTYGYWKGTIKSIKYNEEEIHLYNQTINDASILLHYQFVIDNGLNNNYPKGILKYDSTNKAFEFYSRLGDSNKYFMFRVRLDTNDTDLVYLKEWRWSNGKYCEYNGSTFIDIATTAIDAENEMAMHFASTIDYTGGIHGDERIDVSPDSFVKFFAGGRLISDDEMENDFTIECASFTYIQLSSLHQTSTVDGEFVTGHPIIAMHYKRNTFENCQSNLENRIIFTSEQHVTQYHAGMMCVGKGTATYALLPNAVMTPQLTGTSNLFDADNKKVPRVDMWNPTNGIRCYVEGKMIEGISESDINVLQVWDRTTDSKYYRRMVASNSNAKVFQEGDVIINEQNVVYY